MSGFVFVSGACFIHSDAGLVSGQSGGRQLTETLTPSASELQTDFSLSASLSPEPEPGLTRAEQAEHMAHASVTACAGRDKTLKL